MNIEIIMISGLVGLIAGAVSFLFAEKILSKDLKNRNIIKNVLAIALTTIITMFGNRIFLNSEKIPLTKESIDKGYMKSSLPMFRYIKKNDLQSYEELLEGSLSLFKENSSKSETEIFIIFQKYGAQFTTRYYKNASGEALIKYLGKYIEFLKEASEKEPDTVCRLMFPDAFGPIDENVFVRMKSGAALMTELENIVISGAKKESNDSDKSSATIFETYRTDFFSKHPDIQNLFANYTNIKSDEDKRKLALGVTKLYEEILLLPRSQAVSIYRYLLIGE
ncbi:MAG: hypothetical protein SFU98_13010 [Leptospiraceae bacterium]|nr:hypothetical protein [Leptospiraceae bacterium]